MTQKSVLIIAHDFPPIRTSGIYRPLKFAKYLPEFGWQPVVVSAQPFGVGALDDSMLRELPPDVEVIRATRPSMLDWEARIYQTLLRRDPRQLAQVSKPADATLTPAVPSTKSWRKLLLRGVLSPARAMLQHALYFPDDANLWARHAYRAAVEVVECRKIDAMFSTSSPASAHLVAAALNRRFNIPWVADFRDPWTRNIPKQHDPALRRAIERRVEIAVLRRASEIIYISDTLAELAREAFPMVPASKFHVIENGYDESDFSGAGDYSASPDQPLTMLNVGTIYKSTGFESLLAVIEQLHADQPSLAPRLEHVGPLFSDQKQRLARLDEFGSVSLSGVVPHDRIASIMVRADVHVLTVPDGAVDRPANIPGKLYEQLRSGRPILYVGPENDTSRHIANAEAGWVFRADQREAIAQKLAELVAAKRSGSLPHGAPPSRVGHFERRQLTRQLSDRLVAAVERRNS